MKLAADRVVLLSDSSAKRNPPLLSTILTSARSTKLANTKGVPFIAMELMEGRDAEAYDQRKADGNVDQVLDLGANKSPMHSMRLMQKSYHPPRYQAGQYFCNPDRGHVKLLDFGLAQVHVGLIRRVGTPHWRRRPDYEPGSTMGTVAYMSPEQASGKDLDSRTDLFSFGVVLYEMATGSPPFVGNTPAVVFHEILMKEPAAAVRLMMTFRPSWNASSRRRSKKIAT